MKFLKEIFHPTVDGTMASFQKAVKKLERTSAHHDKLAQQHDRTVEQALIQRGLAQREADRATRIHAKFTDLLGL